MPDDKFDSWVVYRIPVKGNAEGMRAVCDRREWEAMERQRPGFCTLIQADIANEGEAERLARGTSGDSPSRKGKLALAAAMGTLDAAIASRTETA